MIRRPLEQSRRRRKRAARALSLQSLEDRRLLTAAPLGATWKDTGEYLLGTVAVTTVLFESNGAIDPETQDWESEEIQPIVDKVVEGVSWWGTALDKVTSAHDLDFVFDHTHAYQPFETSYEPIERRSQDHQKYVGEFLAAQGYAGELSLENAMWRFNHAQRERLHADWSFTIFIVDASEGDGLFAPGGFPAAFALPGGLYTVVPSERAASTIAHEMGHIFWAFDEYENGASYDANRGYYDAQNLNANEDRPVSAGDQQDSIMWGGAPLDRAFRFFESPASTFALVGWQDSDGDGIFDVLDVPLELNAFGHFDHQNSTYRLTGTAAAVALPNRNSYGEHPSVIGTNADITLNRISEIQYSFGGTEEKDWMTAATPDEQVVTFDLSIPIHQPFDTILWRVIDLTTEEPSDPEAPRPPRVTSEVLVGSAEVPVVPSVGQRGYAFVDLNGNGTRQPEEALLSDATVTIQNADGTPLSRDVVDAADHDGTLPSLPGVTLTVQSSSGPVLDPDLLSLASDAAGGRHVFHAQELEADGSTPAATRDRWAKRQFVAHFDSPVGEVRLDALGLDAETYGRLEAYDIGGNLISRTTELIDEGEWRTLSVNDPRGSIASIRAFGIVHTDTGIAISRLEYGFTDTATTNASGVWVLPHLPDGDYRAEITAERLIHQFESAGISLEIRDGVSPLIAAAASRVDSPRHNPNLPHDANQDGNVTAADALVIINDLARYSARILSADEPAGFDVDVNNDGSATALDALLVINQLSRDMLPGEGEPATETADRDDFEVRDQVFSLIAGDRVDKSVTAGQRSGADFGWGAVDDIGPADEWGRGDFDDEAALAAVPRTNADLSELLFLQANTGSEAARADDGAVRGEGTSGDFPSPIQPEISEPFEPRSV